jgi:hypothetical protein
MFSVHVPGEKTKTALKMNRSERGFENRLASYFMAASAAGVGVLALNQTADAKIVYTPANQTISPRSTFGLDLNADGVTDFTFENFYYVCIPSCSGGDGEHRRTRRNSFAQTLYFGTLIVKGAQSGNGAAGATRDAAAIRPGRPVGPKAVFQTSGLMAAQAAGSAHSSFGNWRGVNGLYLGLKFSIAGETHFGWARLNVHLITQASFSATLTGYAYETVPNQPLLTGEMHGPDLSDLISLRPLPAQPPTLTCLAAGATGIVLWRKKEEED